MQCPTCGKPMLLVRTKTSCGNWCCTQGADCKQRAIPYHANRLRTGESYKSHKAFLRETANESVVSRDFSKEPEL
jgi:ssDNA-binding Zn-finger/Zn-ribbon topoisomerase 1